jgi:hypothetical protein
MDGALAIIFVVTGLTDMTLNDCPTECLERGDAVSRLSVQGAEVIFQSETIDEEIYVGFDLPTRYGPFQLTIGASIAGDGGAWIGAGAKWNSQSVIDSPFFIESSLMPGIYQDNDSPDLGGALQFRSALGAGYTFENGGTLTVLYDHRSNADTQNINPGLETLSLRYAIALR